MIVVVVDDDEIDWHNNSIIIIMIIIRGFSLSEKRLTIGHFSDTCLTPPIGDLESDQLQYIASFVIKYFSFFLYNHLIVVCTKAPKMLIG